jgi:hypothetical protein
MALGAITAVEKKAESRDYTTRRDTCDIRVAAQRFPARASGAAKAFELGLARPSAASPQRVEIDLGGAHLREELVLFFLHVVLHVLGQHLTPAS